MNCRSLSCALPLVNLLVFLFYDFNWHSEQRELAFCFFWIISRIETCLCFWLSKKSLRLAGARRGLQQLGSLAVREHHCSQGNCRVFLWTWCILWSFLTAFSYCFMQIHVIFTGFKEGKNVRNFLSGFDRFLKVCDHYFASWYYIKIFVIYSWEL